MRILVACTRGAGHFNPLVPFLDAGQRAGHDVLVAGPPDLADRVARAGYEFWAGAAPPDADLGPVWAQIPTASSEEAERLVIAEIFATLNVRAMLPGLRAAVGEWRPDVILRDPAEFASAVVADEMGLPHVQAGIHLAEAYREMMSIAAEAVDAWVGGLTDRILAAPSVTLFPASLEDPAVPASPGIHRFRDPAADAPARPLPDWWPGDERPLVYVSFGSQVAGTPFAAPIYDVALEAAAGLPARVLLTTGTDDGRFAASGPHVHVEQWVPQADVLGHARAVVCHGGAGTTLGALAAGVPLVVTPLFADQPHNARRVAAVGAGLVVEPDEPGAMRSAVDPAALREAIEAVLADGAYARSAAVIGEEIRALPPVDEALSVLAAG